MSKFSKIVGPPKTTMGCGLETSNLVSTNNQASLKNKSSQLGKFLQIRRFLHELKPFSTESREHSFPLEFDTDTVYNFENRVTRGFPRNLFTYDLAMSKRWDVNNLSDLHFLEKNISEVRTVIIHNVEPGLINPMVV